MIKKTLERSLTLFLLVIVVLAACATQAPIAVYITPTPPTSLDAAAPTEISEASSTGFTLTSMQTDSNSQPHPTVTWEGPVIGPGYELPSTNTPIPTTPPPTVEGQPTQQAQPTAQPTGSDAASEVTIPGGLPDLDPSKMGIQAEGNLEQ